MEQSKEITSVSSQWDSFVKSCFPEVKYVIPSFSLGINVEKAYEIYEKLMEKNPAFPEAYYNYARVLDKKGDREKAEEMLSTALEKPFNKLTTVTKEEINKYMDEIKGI